MRKVLSFLIIFLFFATPASSTILFYEDFEDALDFANTWIISGGHGSHELTIEQVRSGSKAYKFSLTRYNSGDYREELTLRAGFNGGNYHFTIGNEYWIGFSIFLASGYQSPPTSGRCIVHHQCHGDRDVPPTCDPAEPWRNSPLNIRTENDILRSVSRYDSRQCTPAIGDYEGTYYSDYGAFSTGQWYDFVVNVKWSYGGDGFLEIWKDGVSVTDRAGGNCFNDDKGPYLKIGIYSNGLDQDQTVTIYYDELRIGDSSSSYSEVAPGGCTLPTVTTQAVTDITTTTAIGHGTITNTGGENATKRGICWNTTGTPTAADDKVEEVGNFSTGAFSGNMTGLTPDQAYFARAYAYHTSGYGYGSTEGYNTDADASGTYIIDDGDAETSSTGTWPASGGVNPYGSGSLYCNEVNSTYSFEKTLDGNYTTSMWWTEYSSRSTAVTVKIYDSGDNLLDTKSINQYINGGQWNLLDTYDFNATAKVVILSTGGGPSTCADAVKFDYVEGSGGEDVNNPSCLYGITLQGCVLN